MKKAIALLLAASMTAAMAAGCTSGQPQNNETVATAQGETTAPTVPETTVDDGCMVYDR